MFTQAAPCTPAGIAVARALLSPRAPRCSVPPSPPLAPRPRAGRLRAHPAHARLPERRQVAGRPGAGYCVPPCWRQLGGRVPRLPRQCRPTQPLRSPSSLAVCTRRLTLFAPLLLACSWAASPYSLCCQEPALGLQPLPHQHPAALCCLFFHDSIFPCCTPIRMPASADCAGHDTIYPECNITHSTGGGPSRKMATSHLRTLYVACSVQHCIPAAIAAACTPPSLAQEVLVHRYHTTCERRASAPASSQLEGIQRGSRADGASRENVCQEGNIIVQSIRGQGK